MTFPSIQTSTITSDYGWNEAAGRYIDLSSGRFVPALEVRDALESVIDASSVRINLLAESLVDGRISLAEWQSGMLEQVKLAHVASAASARGGWAQMSQSDWGAAGQLIRTQYDYLRNFSNQIANGEQLLNGSALVRAGMYGDAARCTFEETRRRYEKLMNGMELERRVLGESDHCEDCLDAADEGWQPIGILPAIGDSVCLTNCHCSFEFSTADAANIESEEEQ